MPKSCFTVAELAQYLGCKFIGDGNLEIYRIKAIEEAKKGDITFLANPKYQQKAVETKASCIITSDEKLAEHHTIILCPDPYYSFAQLLDLIYPERESEAGIHEWSYVDDTATLGTNVTIFPFTFISDGVDIGNNVEIHPGVYIGPDTSIGADTRIYANVTIMDSVRIGRRCIVHSGTTIGSDGFGYAFHEGIHFKVPQIGGVEVGDDVEIGANVTIDRGTLGNTRIGNGVKIDNLVQVAHNVQIGDYCILVSQSGISGSAKLGKYVTLAGQTGVVGHIEIGDGVIAGGRAGITKNVPPGKIVSGFPLADHKDFLKRMAAFSNLPQTVKQVRELKKRVEELEKQIEELKK